MKLINCLRTGWENKNQLLSLKIRNLIQLLVSVMSQCSKAFTVNFLELKKDDIWRIWRNQRINLYRKRNLYNDKKKEAIDSNIDLLTNF